MFCRLYDLRCGIADHLSRRIVADTLKRIIERLHRVMRPPFVRMMQATLQQAGFTINVTSPYRAVGSYLDSNLTNKVYPELNQAHSFHPFPCRSFSEPARRYCFCGTFPRVTSGCR